VTNFYKITSTSTLGTYTLLEINLLPGTFDFSDTFKTGSRVTENVLTRYTKEIKLKDIGLREVFGANIHVQTTDNYTGIMKKACTIIDRQDNPVNNAADNNGTSGFNSYPTVGYQTTSGETSLLIGSSDRTSPNYATTEAKLTIIGRR